MQDQDRQEQRDHDGDHQDARPALPCGQWLPGGASAGVLVAAVVPGLLSYPVVRGVVSHAGVLSRLTAAACNSFIETFCLCQVRLYLTERPVYYKGAETVDRDDRRAPRGGPGRGPGRRGGPGSGA